MTPSNPNLQCTLRLNPQREVTWFVEPDQAVEDLLAQLAVQVTAPTRWQQGPFTVEVVQDVGSQDLLVLVYPHHPGVLSLVFEHAPIGMALVALSGQWMEVNPALCKMLGYTREELLKLTFQDITHKDDLDTDLAHAAQLLSGEIEAYQMEKRYFRKDGGVLWIQLSGSVVKDPHGKPVFFIAQIQDISQQKETAGQLQQARQHLQSILDHMPAMIGYWDRDLTNRFANQAYVEWFGWTPQQMQGHHIREVLGEVLFQKNLPYMLRALAGEVQHFNREITDPTGQLRHSQASYIPDVQGGKVQGFFVLVSDVTELKQREGELHAQKEQARITLASIADGVITTNQQGKVTFMNPVAEQMTGWASDEASGRPIEQVMVLRREHSRLEVINPVRVALQENRTVEMVADALLVSRSGTEHPIEDSAAPILNAQGEVLGAVLVFHPVGATRQLALQMTHLARHDPLTGLPNRLLLLDRITEAFGHAQRTGASFAVLFLDLDQFKAINDTLGHHRGDLLLQQIARRLEAVLRSTDTVSRQGGDEFVVLLTDVPSPEQLQSTVDRILQEIRKPYVLDDQELVCTFSIGVALYPQDGVEVHTLIQHADAAMYQAKRQGRNRSHFYSKDIREALEKHHGLQHALEQAVEKKDFEVHYQPIVNMETQQLVGFEALVRWKKDGMLILPASFIPLAEEMGWMVPIGHHVLRQALKDLQQWRQMMGQHFTVAVNLSFGQVTDPQLLETVQGLLQEFQLPASSLEFEITEHTLMHDVKQVLGDLRSHGIRVSMDDFGTGFSSLALLQDLPVNRLKIDRSFVTGMKPGEAGRGPVQAGVSLAKALGLDVIAEGVEDETQKDLLLHMGCPVLQGYWVARPMPARKIPGWIRAWLAR